jgi:hypothetical protein
MLTTEARHLAPKLVAISWSTKTSSPKYSNVTDETKKDKAVNFGRNLSEIEVAVCPVEDHLGELKRS